MPDNSTNNSSTNSNANFKGNSDFQNVFEIYTRLKTMRDQTKPLWDDISKYVGINVDTDYAWVNNASRRSAQLDEFVDDPTSAISVNQAGDYLVGVMWGTGEGVFDIEPSRYVLELAEKDELEDYFAFITDQTEYHMSHPQAGYMTALRPYSYDQFAFGTSGIGIFPNEGFKQRVDDNALTCRNYGVDSVVIDEGKSGLVDYVFATYHWRISRIVGEFAMKDGVIDPTMLKALPKRLQEAYASKDMNQEFDIVFGMLPRTDFDPKFKGKRGTRYRGIWFMADGQTGRTGFFHEESFTEKPINMARMILVRGEVWGRSSGTMLLSSIRSVNYMIGTAIEVIEKMADPALGMFSNAIFGDSVLDTSPSGLTVFNSALTGGQAPTFPLYDVGDPQALVQFLVPYLNEKITTAFKVDALLDFSSDKEMTATESIQRFVIRGQSLSGILSQQKNERLIPDINRAISILLDMGELGTNPRTNQNLARQLAQRGKPERVIPDAVLQIMESGRPWFELRFNNELEKLVRTENLKNLMQTIQAISAIFPLQPNIVEAVDWYKLLKDINNNLDANSQILLSEREFKEKIQAQAQQQQIAALAQLNESGAEANRNEAEANRANSEAKNNV